MFVTIRIIFTKVQKIKFPGMSGREIPQDDTSKVQKINWKGIPKRKQL